MDAITIIRKKRDGNKLTSEEISFIVNGYTAGIIPDYQVSAFLMAVFLRGMDKTETAHLTAVMLHSGKVLDLSSIPGVKTDKHSTGGVGDKTSLIIAPIAAAVGVPVPMISGRGLGHTGGTLDKLESIPGFKINLNLSAYKRILRNTGAVLIGQTKEIAPADKLIYALRDVTATVESIPLITASIMSKKLAEGIDSLVLDVKTGSGAFMKSFEDSKNLAKSLVNTAKSFNKKVLAFITDMNQPLGRYIGNWLEVCESVMVLQGERVPRLYELSVTLAGAMIYLGGKAKTLEDGIQSAESVLKSGAAFDKFVEIVAAQGGNTKYLYNMQAYPRSHTGASVVAERSGYITSIDTYIIGMASLKLGAGRLKKEDSIEPKAGIIFYPEIGSKIEKGQLIAELFTDDEPRLNEAIVMVKSAVVIGTRKVKAPKLIKEVLT